MTAYSQAPAATTSLARQAVLDRSGVISGYELLFRGTIPASGFDNRRATSQVLVAAACDLGWDRLGGGLPLFVNVDADMLTSPLITLSPPLQTVIEIIEDVVVDDAIEQRVHELRALGYRVALDDFVPGGPAERLLPHVDVVKVDVLAVPAEHWPELVARLHAHGVLAVAEKIETDEAHQAALDAGFDLFQGYLYSRPAGQASMALSPRQVVCLRLLGELTLEDFDMREVETLVTSDAALVLRTLRIANSAAYGASRSISSVAQALVMVGPVALSGWIALMMVTSDDAPEDQTAMGVLVHARACQIVSRSRLGGSGGQAFLAGLVLALARHGGLAAETVLETLGASEVIRLAVLTGEGEVGRLVSEVADHVDGTVTGASFDVQLAHMTAVVWSNDLLLGAA